MRIGIEQRGDEAVVVAGGQLCASQAGLLRQALLQAFEKETRVRLELREVGEVDLSFLQVLCAAHRTAAARTISFTLGGLASAAAVRRLICAAGARRGPGCPGRCLWDDDPVPETPEGCAPNHD